MANAYTLSMSNIQTTEISISVTGKDQPLTLTTTPPEVKIQKLNGSTFQDFTNFTLTNISGDVGAANPKTATILPDAGHEFTTSDVLLIQIIATEDAETKYSDTVIVDYDQQYTNLESEYELKLPLAAGNYILKLDNVINENFSTAQASSEFTLAANHTKPIPASSSIEISRPDLVHFTDETLEIKVILDNVGHDVPDGGYQVSFSADLQ